MSDRRKFALAAVVVGMVEIAWLFASNFRRVDGWIEKLRRSNQVGAAVSGLVVRPVFNLLVMCIALYLAYHAFRMRSKL